MNKIVGFVSETGDSAFFFNEDIKNIAVISSEKYIVSCGDVPLTEVNGLSYAEFEIDKCGDTPHLAFQTFDTDIGEFRWLIQNQDSISQIILGDEENETTYHLTENQNVSVSVVAGALYIEIK